VSLYQFAEKYGFTTLQNDIITEFFILNRDGCFPPLAVVRRVFERIGPNSTLATLMVGWHVFHLDKDCIPSAEDLEEGPSFSARLARAYMEKLKGHFDDPFANEPDKFFVIPRATDVPNESLEVRVHAVPRFFRLYFNSIVCDQSGIPDT
jgi:hypothetical protein